MWSPLPACGGTQRPPSPTATSLLPFPASRCGHSHPLSLAGVRRAPGGLWVRFGHGWGSAPPAVRPAFLLSQVSAFKSCIFFGEEEKCPLSCLNLMLRAWRLLMSELSKIYVCVSVHICNYISAICRIKIYIRIWLDIGACACIFGAWLGQSRTVLHAQPSSALPPCLTLPPPWPLPAQPLAFSKVISTFAFLGLGGRLWGLSVPPCAKQHCCSLPPEDKVQRETSGCVLS